jgi:hypothetical protein
MGSVKSVFRTFELRSFDGEIKTGMAFYRVSLKKCF